MRRFLLVPTLTALFFLGAGATTAENRVIAPPGTDLGLPFSAGVLAGDFLYLSGAIGNPPGTVAVQGDTAAQTRQTLENLKAVLAAAGMDFSRVVDANVYLADIRHLAPMAAVFAEAVGDRPPPARTTVEADIAVPGALTEISAIAARPGVEIRPVSPDGWPASAGLYGWGMMAGDTLFVAGMVSHDPKTGVFVPGDAGAQVKRAMENVGAVLAAAGLGYGDVAGCRVFLPDARDFAALNEVYPTFFSDAAPPARATVRARLVDPSWRVEIQCRAVRGGDRRAVLPPGATPRKVFSPAIRVGDRLFLSGMVGRGPEGYPAGVAAQTGVVLERLAATLAAGGMSFRDVVETAVFLTDIRHYGAMNEVYRRVVGSPPPARATVGTQLMSPEALVEIQMTAVKSRED